MEVVERIAHCWQHVGNLLAKGVGAVILNHATALEHDDRRALDDAVTSPSGVSLRKASPLTWHSTRPVRPGGVRRRRLRRIAGAEGELLREQAS